MNRPEIVVLDDAATVADATARRVIDAAKRAQGGFSIALAGGSTPKAAYGLLAGPYADEIDWARVAIYFGDERCVPPESPDANFRMATQALLVPLAQAGKSPKSIARIEGELDPDEAARRYAAKLEILPRKDDVPVFDLVLLGMGADGHTASLFPGASILHAEGHVAATAEPHLGSRRVSLTYAVLDAAREIVVSCTGAEKAASLKLAVDGRWGAVPLRDVRPRDGRMIILCDRAAAARLG
jgi:6-phosphogluconolactonase